MAITTLLGNTYPDENQDPYWTTIRSFFLAEDEWLQANYEDKSILVFGGGTMTLIGSTFSWSAPLYIVSQRSVTKITISASSVTVADGEVLYVTTGARPISNQTLTLQAGSPVTKNDIPIGYRDGATVHIKDLTFLSGYELDDAYNASSGAASVSVDAGDVTWDTVGTYSFNVDLAATTGTADGFNVVDGTDYLRLIHKAANALDLESELRNIDFNSSGTISLDAVGTLNIDSDGATIIGGASVALTADGGILSLTGDGAADIDISNAGAGIDVDSATLLVDTTSGFSIDAAAASNLSTTSSNLTLSTITSGTLFVTSAALLDVDANVLDIDAVNAITIDSAAAGISLDAVTASNFTVSGATAHLTLGAYGTTITLNQAGNTALTGGFAATSLIGAINENAADIALLAGTTLDDAYNNDAGAADITVDAGDVSWDLTGAYSFIVDLAATTGTADGFKIVNGLDQFNLIRDDANKLDLDADLQNADISCDVTMTLAAGGALNLITPTIASFVNATHDHADAAGGGQIELDDVYNNSAGASTITVDAGDLTFDVNGLYSHVVDIVGCTAAGPTGGVDGFLVEGGDSDYFRLTNIWVEGGSVGIALDADLYTLDIDVAGTLAMDASGTIEWSGTNAALTSAGALSLASNITLTGGGDIITTSNGNIDLIPNGSGITTIGGGVGTRSLNTPNDIVVNGKLEIKGTTYCDSNLLVSPTLNSVGLLLFSDVTTYGGIERGLDDGMKFIVGATSANRNLIICDSANYTKDFDHDALSPNPTQYWQSVTDPDVDNTQWGSATHDQTDFLLDSGTLTTKFASGLKYNVTTVNAATYDLLASDYIVHVTYAVTGAVTSLTLPTAQAVSGRFVMIKDASGNASGFNITIDTQGAETIDGAADIDLTTDYEWIVLYSDGSDWFVIGG